MEESAVRINTNIMAFNAYRNLSSTQDMMAKSLEKLSSGYRINRAADDASGLVISQGLQAQVSGLQQATRNAQDGISVAQTAEGALSTVHSMLGRIRDLIVQSANTASSDATARQAAQNEITQLRSEIDRIAGTTAFGTQKLLNGTFGSQEARATTVTTGTGAGVTVGASNTFDLTVDAGGTSLSVTVTVSTGTYTTAASLQSSLQAGVSAALTAGFTGTVTVNVRDLGSGAWSTEFVRNTTASTGKLTFANMGSGVQGVTNSSSAATATSTGGVFQVGANVTATDQITLSIADMRITGGTVGALTALSGIDVTNTSTYSSAQSLIDSAITEVSTVRGGLGAVQNRFESTISNLQVTTENLSASESRIKDTDMSLEMVNFTRNQILVQAGTSMLAQANSAPQTVLKLLQLYRYLPMRVEDFGPPPLGGTAMTTRLSPLPRGRRP
jgi:flagellin